MRLMARKPLIPHHDSTGPAGPYDAVTAEPWFVPQGDAGAGYPPWRQAVSQPFWPQAERGPLVVADDWAAAQGALSAELAGLAVLYGALEERLRAGPAGWRHRLALREAADLSWAVGDRIPPERLALWQALRLSGVQEDAQGLERAAWALRRLMSGAGGGLAAFFGRQGGQDEVEGLVGLLAGLGHLHPVTRAVALGQVWQMTGDAGAARQIEAVVLAGCVAADMGRANMGRADMGGFVPQAAAGQRGVPGGRAEAALAGWLRGATRATQGALLHLDQIAAWTRRAPLALTDLQGRTPPALLDVLAEWPMVTTGLAERLTGASKASVMRNLGLMQARGVLREVTGQGRYRVWTAAV